MNVQGTTKAKWQLTQTGFDGLLAALDEDREKGGEKYHLLRTNLIRFFETRGFAASEDAADEVFNRLARKIEGGEQFENIQTYALAIARYLALELRKSPDQKTSNELPEIGISPFDNERERRENELKCLEHCLNELPKENREIIMAYYQGDGREKIENRQKLAEKLSIPQNALRNRAVRLRDKLESCISGCLR